VTFRTRLLSLLLGLLLGIINGMGLCHDCFTIVADIRGSRWCLESATKDRNIKCWAVYVANGIVSVCSLLAHTFFYFFLK
jgi:hypothetical protein